MEQTSPEYPLPKHVIMRSISKEELPQMISATLEETLFQGLSTIHGYADRKGTRIEEADDMDHVKELALEQIRRLQELQRLITKAEQGEAVRVKQYPNLEIFYIPTTLEIEELRQTVKGA